MRYLASVLMLAAMASFALAQDPHGNRMNYQYPATGEQVARPGPDSGLPPPHGNRMNVVYGKVESNELLGWPNPHENRMNFQWPKAQAKPAPKFEPKEIERLRVDP